MGKKHLANLIGSILTLCSVFSLFGTKETSQSLEVASDGQAEINIFTVASGLLYEVCIFLTSSVHSSHYSCSDLRLS